QERQSSTRRNGERGGSAEKEIRSAARDANDRARVARGGARRKTELAERRFWRHRCYFFSARRFFAHSGLTTCWARPRPSESAGTGAVITDPAPTYAPSPTSIGATRVELLPMKAPSP